MTVWWLAYSDKIIDKIKFYADDSIFCIDDLVLEACIYASLLVVAMILVTLHHQTLHRLT
jgi:hypothetical protein